MTTTDAKKEKREIKKTGSPLAALRVLSPYLSRQSSEQSGDVGKSASWCRERNGPAYTVFLEWYDIRREDTKAVKAARPRPCRSLTLVLPHAWLTASILLPLLCECHSHRRGGKLNEDRHIRYARKPILPLLSLPPSLPHIVKVSMQPLLLLHQSARQGT